MGPSSRRSRARHSVAVGAVVAALLPCAAACGEDEPASEAPPAPTPTTRQSEPVAAAAIIGEWRRRTTCQQRVRALERAGLGEFAAEHAAGEGWLPGVGGPDEIKDPAHPCRGAVPLQHGHFFTNDGMFGSRDAQGDQVDDGIYRVVDENTIVIHKEFGDIRFDFRIRDDSLVLHPVIPGCRKSGCFAAQWAVGMAYPGLPWHRVD